MSPALQFQRSRPITTQQFADNYSWHSSLKPGWRWPKANLCLPRTRPWRRTQDCARLDSFPAAVRDRLRRSSAPRHPPPTPWSLLGAVKQSYRHDSLGPPTSRPRGGAEFSPRFGAAGGTESATPRSSPSKRQDIQNIRKPRGDSPPRPPRPARCTARMEAAQQ